MQRPCVCMYVLHMIIIHFEAEMTAVCLVIWNIAHTDVMYMHTYMHGGRRGKNATAKKNLPLPVRGRMQMKLQ